MEHKKRGGLAPSGLPLYGLGYRTIRFQLIQSKDATTSERLELLWKIQASATKGKPRGRAFAKKANGEVPGRELPISK